jgi:regulator of replication initiation timing
MSKDKQSKEDMNKLQRIEEEIKKLSRQYTKLDRRTKKTLTSLIENAAFMIVTLEDLQETINENGVISEYQNGENQWGTKKSPEVEIYNTMIKNHMTIMKQLTDLLPPEEVKPKEDEFESFMSDR